MSGEAENVVNGLMLLDSEDAYNKAKEMLAKRFGNLFTVASGFRRKLEQWKPLASNDEIGLKNYVDFLVQCKKAMEKVSSLIKIMIKKISKLQPSYQDGYQTIGQD